VAALFLRAVRRLANSGCLTIPDDCSLDPLSSGDAPPSLFAQKRSLHELEDRCAEIERAFGTLLNSFPDDPLPTSIQPHARVYSLAYLGMQVQRIPLLAELMPVVMLDDVQELYPDQRRHVKDEFIRRASIPRWLAVRSHVFGLEELISVEGADQGREYREIALDQIFQERPSVFAKFATNVVHRRLQHTDSLQQVTVGDFKDLLRAPPELIPADAAREAIEGMAERVASVRAGTGLQARLTSASGSGGTNERPFEDLLNLEQELIAFERQANRGQVSLFPDLDAPEVSNGKTSEAAKLFVTRRLRWPYYWGFETWTSVASGNVEQLLATTASVVDRMIYRAELDREKAILSKEQEEILKRGASEYYGALEEKHRRGSAIRQFVDNLGLFFEEVTYRPNAPIAPGVNGFGLTRRELEGAAGPAVQTREAEVFREVLTNAVAGNVLSVRITKQGQAGAEKIVFYLNRLLCVRFRLPLNYGGWQHLPIPLLAKMMQEPLPLREMTRRGGSDSPTLWDERGDG